MTEILKIEPQRRDILTRTNADWLEGWYFEAATSADAIPDTGNAGTGSIGLIAVGAGAIVGLYRVVITAKVGPLTYFGLTDLDGTEEFARGVVGLALSAEGLTFTVLQGATPYAIGDGFTLSVLTGPLDITGITFRTMWRPTLAGAASYDIRPRLSLASDASPKALLPPLINGGPIGVLSPQVVAAQMRRVPSGTYDYDLIAIADGYTKLAAFGTITHDPGVTII